MKKASVIIVAVVLVAIGTVLLWPSPEDKSSFTPESFVDSANENDAGIELGETLDLASTDHEVRAVRFLGTSPAPEQGGPLPTDAHGAGTLSVFDDNAAAIAEYDRCQTADLVCYRVENVELTFTGTIDPGDLAQFTAAVEAMGGA